jgi:hypothetical protein
MRRSSRASPKLFTRNLTTRFTMENTRLGADRTLTISFDRYQ